LPHRKTQPSEFFPADGCENKPRKIEIKSELTSKEKELQRKRNYESRNHQKSMFLNYDMKD
jgi:hypothetical protein